MKTHSSGEQGPREDKLSEFVNNIKSNYSNYSNSNSTSNSNSNSTSTSNSNINSNSNNNSNSNSSNDNNNVKHDHNTADKTEPVGGEQFRWIAFGKGQTGSALMG